MVFVAAKGFRAIAHDRRGHGRSSQPWDGDDMDTYADDLAALIETLDLGDAVLVGHSTGGCEVARYIGRHGTSRLSKAALVGTPLRREIDANPDVLPTDAFEGIRASLTEDREQFYRDLSAPYYGGNRPGAQVSQGLRGCVLALGDAGRSQGRTRLHQGALRDGPDGRPQEVRHSRPDPQRRRRSDVPIGASVLSSRIVKDAILKVYPGAGHGLTSTQKDQFNADLLCFLRS